MFESRKTGLLDFLATWVAVVAVYTGTPVGGLVERGVRAALGLPPPTDGMTTYFEVEAASGPASPPDEAARRALSESQPQDEVLGALAPAALPRELTRAFAVVASGGVVTLDPTGRPFYDIRPLPHHHADRVALGLSPPRVESVTDEATLTGGVAHRLREALELLAAYQRRFGAVEPALAAWVLGQDIVDRAIARARLLGEAEPRRFDRMRPYLTHDQARRSGQFVSAVLTLRTAYGMQWPVDARFPITSGYGMRVHPTLRIMKHHDGVDIAAPEGTPIRAVADGTVRYAGSDGVNGLYVKVDHGHGLSTAYCHASRLLVRPGDRVRRGQVVAKVGASGRATGPHLHYGVFVGGRPVDPELFRPAGLALAFEAGAKESVSGGRRSHPDEEPPLDQR